MGLIYNVKWVSISQSVKVFSQIIGMIIFSRYLTPHEIGVMSLTLIIVNFVNVFRDMGTSSVIIQREELSNSLITSVFYINTFIGICFFLLCYNLSGVLSHFFSEVALNDTIKIIAYAFPINSMSVVYLSLLERYSKFNLIAKVEILASLLSLLIAILCALNHVGVYSLVIQTLSYSILSSIGFVFYSRWSSFGMFNFGEVKKILGFSSNVVGFNIINYLSRNSDQIIIGRFFSATTLGMYSLAYRIMLFPIQNITFVLTRSLYPLLSRLQGENAQATSIYYKVIKSLAILTPPLLLGLISVRQDFVDIVFGEKWLAVSDLILWLAPTAILQSLVSTTGSVFMSQGRANLLFLISIYNAILQVGAFLIGSFYQIDTLIKLYFLANLLMFFPNMYLAVKLIGGHLKEVIVIIIKPLVGASLMSVCVSYLRVYYNFALIYNIDSAILRLSIDVIFGVLIYSFYILLVERDFARDKLKKLNFNIF